MSSPCSLDLKDVYWAKQGRSSVDLGVGISSLAGTYFAARPLLRALSQAGQVTFQLG